MAHTETRECLPMLMHHHARFPSQNWMSLVCCLGNVYTPLTLSAVAPRLMPTRDESLIMSHCMPMGSAKTFRAAITGELLCFANDAHGLYWNNHGTLSIRIKVIEEEA